MHAVVSDIPLLLLNQPVEWVCNNLWQEREGNHWIMENISVLQNTSMLATFYTHAHFLAVNCIASFLTQWWRKYNHKTYNLTMQAHTILLFLSVDLYSLILLVYWWSVQLRDISMHVLNKSCPIHTSFLSRQSCPEWWRKTNHIPKDVLSHHQQIPTIESGLWP